eukprot:TRINITY_DN8458_c0_g1_i6.p1 TRINITY_DN8458_c0_g1~~TRINITY_DN8458_c0_g1_i6.p1  ORF type:complete len:334 (-),score=175.97 TRINITY_DN8458_c0_g1_i6:100-1101(-)
MAEHEKEELPEKDRSQIKQDKEKFLLKIEKIMKAKDKSEDDILKELYSTFVERVKARLQKNREIQSNLKLMEMAKTEKANAAGILEKYKKELAVLRGVDSTLDKQNQEWQDKYKAIVERHQEERKELNQRMKDEVEKVQEEMNQELQRKHMLAQENEALTERIQQMRQMLKATSENVEKVLGKDEFDVEKMEEQMKAKIEAETLKIASDEKGKLRKQNKELRKTVAEKEKELAECTKKFEEYKEKIGTINSQVNEYKTELEDTAKKIMDIYEENKATETRIEEIKAQIKDIKKQMEKPLHEKAVLTNLKATLEKQLKEKQSPAAETENNAASS